MRPRLYGGTECVVAIVTGELVRRGKDVTLVATADSTTAATLVPAWPEALRPGAAMPISSRHTRSSSST